MSSRVIQQWPFRMLDEPTVLDVPVGSALLPLLRIDATRTATAWFDHPDAEGVTEERHLMVLRDGYSVPEGPRLRAIWVAAVTFDTITWHLFELRRVR